MMDVEVKQRNRRRKRAQRMQAQRENIFADPQASTSNTALNISSCSSVNQADAADTGDEDETHCTFQQSRLKEKLQRPPNRRKKQKEPLVEEDIIEGFSILQFKTFEDLELVVKISEEQSITRLVDIERPKPEKKSTLPHTVVASSQSSQPTIPLTTQDPATSDDSGRASGRLTSSSVPPRDADSSRDQLSDASSHCSSGKGYICDSEGEDDKGSDASSVIFASTPSIRKHEFPGAFPASLPRSNGGSTSPIPAPTPTNLPPPSPAPAQQPPLPIITTPCSQPDLTKPIFSQPSVCDMTNSQPNRMSPDQTLITVCPPSISPPKQSKPTPVTHVPMVVTEDVHDTKHNGSNSFPATSTYEYTSNNVNTQTYHPSACDKTVVTSSCTTTTSASVNMNESFSQQLPVKPFSGQLSRDTQNTPSHMYSPYSTYASYPTSMSDYQSVVTTAVTTSTPNTVPAIPNSSQNLHPMSSVLPLAPHLNTPPISNTTVSSRVSPCPQFCQVPNTGNNKPELPEPIPFNEKPPSVQSNNVFSYGTKTASNEETAPHIPCCISASPTSNSVPSSQSLNKPWARVTHTTRITDHSISKVHMATAEHCAPIPVQQVQPLPISVPRTSSPLNSGISPSPLFTVPSIPPAPPPITRVSPLPATTAQTTTASTFSAKSLFQPNHTDMLRRELDNRFLAAHDHNLGVTPSPYLRTEMHQHQHHHTHVHQHTTSLIPPTAASTLFPPQLYKDIPKLGSVGSPFYRQSVPSMTNYPSYPANFLHPGLGTEPAAFATANALPAYQPKIVNQEASTKKFSRTGKWNAMHVRVAWEIYHHQQQKGSDIKMGHHSKPDLLRPPGHLISNIHGNPRPHDISSYTAMLNSHRLAPYDQPPAHHNSIYATPPSHLGSTISPFSRFATAAVSSANTTLGAGSVPPYTIPSYPSSRELASMSALHDPWRGLPRAMPVLPPPINSVAPPISMLPASPWSLKPDPILEQREREERERLRREREERERREKEEKQRRLEQQQQQEQRERERREKERREMERERLIHQQRIVAAENAKHLAAVAAAASLNSSSNMATSSTLIRDRSPIRSLHATTANYHDAHIMHNSHYPLNMQHNSPHIPAYHGHSPLQTAPSLYASSSPSSRLHPIGNHPDSSKVKDEVRPVSSLGSDTMVANIKEEETRYSQPVVNECNYASPLLDCHRYVNGGAASTPTSLPPVINQYTSTPSHLPMPTSTNPWPSLLPPTSVAVPPSDLLYQRAPAYSDPTLRHYDVMESMRADEERAKLYCSSIYGNMIPTSKPSNPMMPPSSTAAAAAAATSFLHHPNRTGAISKDALMHLRTGPGPPRVSVPPLPAHFMNPPASTALSMAASQHHIPSPLTAHQSHLPHLSAAAGPHSQRLLNMAANPLHLDHLSMVNKLAPQHMQKDHTIDIPR